MSPTARMRTALAADHLSPPRRPPEKVATVVRPRRGRRRSPHGDLHRQSDTDRNHHPGALPGRPARGTQTSPETPPAADTASDASQRRADWLTDAGERVYAAGVRAYSMDLRERIVAAVDAGMTQSQAAARFGVSLRTVERYLARRPAT